MSDEHRAAEESESDDHLAAVEDGAGCVEIWETLSEMRDGD